MDIKFAQVIFWENRFYIPSFVESEGELIIYSNPIHELDSDADVQQLASVIKNVLDLPRPRVPEILRSDWKKRKDPLLYATHAKNWRDINKYGAMYAITWTKKELRLDISRTDRLEYDGNKAKIYLPDTPIEEIVNEIQDDLRITRKLI